MEIVKGKPWVSEINAAVPVDHAKTFAALQEVATSHMRGAVESALASKRQATLVQVVKPTLRREVAPKISPGSH